MMCRRVSSQFLASKFRNSFGLDITAASQAWRGWHDAGANPHPRSMQSQFLLLRSLARIFQAGSSNFDEECDVVFPIIWFGRSSFFRMWCTLRLRYCSFVNWWFTFGLHQRVCCGPPNILPLLVASCGAGWNAGLSVQLFTIEEVISYCWLLRFRRLVFWSFSEARGPYDRGGHDRPLKTDFYILCLNFEIWAMRKYRTPSPFFLGGGLVLGFIEAK